MSFVERFKKAESIDTEYEVPFLVITKGAQDMFKLKIARPADAERQGAAERAKAKAVKAGIDVSGFKGAIKPEVASYYTELVAAEIGEVLKRHIKNWTHEPPKGEQPVEFNDANLTCFLQRLDSVYTKALGVSYLAVEAMDNAEQKKSQEASSAEALEKSS